MDQLAEAITREYGILASQAIENPRGQPGPTNTQSYNQFHEQAKAVTTLQDELVSIKISWNPTIVYEKRNNREEKLNQNKEKDREKHKKEELSTLYIPKAPFPAALEANTPSPFTKKGVRIDEMMELFKQVQINLPLLDAIKHVPSYAKFLKDLCTQKRRLQTQVPNKVLLT